MTISNIINKPSMRCYSIKIGLLRILFSRKKALIPFSFFFFNGLKKINWVAKSRNINYLIRSLLNFIWGKLFVKKYNSCTFLLADATPQETTFLLGLLTFFTAANPVLKQNKLIFLRINYANNNFFLKIYLQLYQKTVLY